MVDHIKISLTDLREGILRLSAHRRYFYDIAVGPHAALGRDLPKACHHRCIHQIRMCVGTRVHVDDIDRSYVIHLLDRDVLGKSIDHAGVKSAADDRRQVLFAELLIVGIFRVDIAGGRSLRNI